MTADPAAFLLITVHPDVLRKRDSSLARIAKQTIDCLRRMERLGLQKLAHRQRIWRLFYNLRNRYRLNFGHKDECWHEADF